MSFRGSGVPCILGDSIALPAHSESKEISRPVLFNSFNSRVETSQKEGEKVH